MSVFGVFLVRIFPHSDWMRTTITPNTDTFHAVTVISIEKLLINDHLRVSKVSWKFRILTSYNFAVIYLWNIFLKSSPTFQQILSLLFINKILQFSNLNTRTGMNAKISVFVICVEEIKYLINLQDFTFNVGNSEVC